MSTFTAAVIGVFVFNVFLLIYLKASWVLEDRRAAEIRRNIKQPGRRGERPRA